MKILIVGLGNVGVMHGWALSQAGLDVTHIIREGQTSQYEHGISMDILDMRKTPPQYYPSLYKPKVTEEIPLSQGYELVIIPTTHLTLIEAVRQYALLAQEAPFLFFSANWQGTQAIDALLPKSSYLWGFSMCSGSRGTDGTLYANIRDSYRIGEVDGSYTERLKKIIAMFEKAGMHPDRKSNIIEWQWIHHAIDAGLLGMALSYGALPGPNDSLDMWLLGVRAVRDALSVVAKRGVNIQNYPDTKPFYGASDENLAEALRQSFLEQPHYDRIRQHSHFDTSPREMRQYYLDVVETGKALGMTLPYLAPLQGAIEAHMGTSMP